MNIFLLISLNIGFVAQKNHLIETVLLCAHNIMCPLRNKKYFYSAFLPWGLNFSTMWLNTRDDQKVLSPLYFGLWGNKNLAITFQYNLSSRQCT